jgi:4-hydroxy-3-methylbut-2-enyl diphosphate reductase
MGIRILPDKGEAASRYAEVTAGDVVILPAFGVTVAEMAELRGRGCVLVDTTCGSVLNVWKNVHKYADDGFTAVIHGKHYHEETKATASQALTHSGGPLPLRAGPQGGGGGLRVHPRRGGSRTSSAAQFAHAASPGFDPARDLARIGLANQTTMLMSESLEIQEMLRKAMLDRHGEAETAGRSGPWTRSAPPPRTGRTPSCACSTTAGSISWSSSAATTAATPRLSPASAPPGCPRTTSTPRTALRPPCGHRPVRRARRGRRRRTGCPPARCGVGLTAGASTPNNVVGGSRAAALALRGRTVEELGGVVGDEKQQQQTENRGLPAGGLSSGSACWSARSRPIAALR